MTKIVLSPDCSNSPKNLLVQTLVVAIETSNRTAFAKCVTEGVTWAVPGRTLEGKTAALEHLVGGRRDAPKKVTVEHAISHGRAGAGDGVAVLASGAARGFCHVVEFSSAKGERIAQIRSYYADPAHGE
jgi:hypothetical protein